MNIFGWVVLFAAIPLILLAYACLPARRATVVAAVGCWLFMPQYSIPIAGLPDYSKVTALSIGLMVATMLFEPKRLTNLRFRWYDLPMVIWCLGGPASVLANDLGPYSAASAFLSEVILWGLPYVLGRAYFSDEDGLRELATGIVGGGLLYLPLCLYEIRMSPQMHRVFFGFSPQGDSFAGHAIRWGGYRPLVFLLTGLELGLYMAAAAVVAYGLWSAGSIRKVLGVPIGWACLALCVTTVLCKSTGAILLLAVGLAALWLSKRLGSLIPLWILALAAPVFLVVRIPHILEMDPIIQFISVNVDADRAASFAFRVRNEDLIMTKAWQRPLLGWGGEARGFIYDEQGQKVTTVDSFWIYLLSKYGLIGLVCMTTLQIIPLLLWLRRMGKQTWARPAVAPGAAAMVALALWSHDNLVNAMYNPIYMLIAGGLMGWTGSPASVFWKETVDRGRELKLAGRLSEAATAWRDALQSLPTRGDTPALRRCRADIHNDLAWILSIDPASRAYDPEAAASHAQAALDLDPDHAAAWNTRGLAMYRCGQYDAAIRAMQRSIDRAGGTGFDLFPLAMAYHYTGDRDRASQNLDQAVAWTRSRLPNHPELRSLWAEATQLIQGRPPAGVDSPSAHAGPR